MKALRNSVYFAMIFFFIDSRKANSECQNLDNFYWKPDTPEVHPDSAPLLGSLRPHSSLTHLVKGGCPEDHRQMWRSKTPSCLEATQQFNPWQHYYFYLQTLLFLSRAKGSFVSPHDHPLALTLPSSTGSCWNLSNSCIVLWKPEKLNREPCKWDLLE